jgi:SAM-dependent MidA family methyltransferase
LPEQSGLAERLANRIAAKGPITVERYIAESNAHYYASGDPIGASGDFITAPEISQMFGELIGLWLTDLWARAGRPDDACFVELGPGRGTLAADALRAMRIAGLEPSVHLIENSPTLRSAQAERVPRAHWHDRIQDLPECGPLLIVANEFFDALPIRQFVRCADGWRERVVAVEAGRFVPQIGDLTEVSINAPEATIVETAPAAEAIVAEVARRLASQGGAALIIDYGHERAGFGDTLQAVRRHAFADPWTHPGECDLTAHVDFEAIARSASRSGARIFGPLAQGVWLTAMGIDVRAANLAMAAPDRSEEIEAARRRLTAPDQMGALFKVLALTDPKWPLPSAV